MNLKILQREMKQAQLTPFQRRAALILYTVNGYENASEYVRKCKEHRQAWETAAVPPLKPAPKRTESRP